MRRAWIVLFGLFLALAGGQAHADSCSASMTDVVFTPVSPIAGANAYATGTVTVTCTWTGITSISPFPVLLPNATVCLYLGNGTNSASTTPRQLKYGSQTLNYNLYSDASYAAAKIWGAPAVTATPVPIVLNMTKTGSAGSIVQTVTVYGKLTADASLAAAQTAGTSSAWYISDFGAGSAAIQYFFFVSGLPGCTLGPVAGLSFEARAEVINDCTINVNTLAFPSSGLLSSALRSTATMSVGCSANAAYQIALNGGSVAGNVAARAMKNTINSDQVSYQLSNTLDGTIWGDGTAGTIMVTGTGDGTVHTQTVYGKVPAQSSVTPGNYSDTVTALVSF